MHSIEDMPRKFFINIYDYFDDEATILIEEYYAKVRQYEQELRERAAKLSEVLNDAVGYIPKCRPPVEIKRDIKHEKNPMRLKQLNQELNESYKYYKRTKKND